MKIFVIHGQMHHGNTDQLTHQLLQQLVYEVLVEFYLIQDAPHFCIGCFNCFRVALLCLWHERRVKSFSRSFGLPLDAPSTIV